MSRTERDEKDLSVPIQSKKNLPQSSESTEDDSSDHPDREAHGETDLHAIEARRLLHLTTTRVTGWHLGST